MAEYRDLAGFDDVGPDMAEVTGAEAMRQSLARWLITPTGALPWAPERGTDLREILHDSPTAARVEGSVVAEMMRSDGVESATAVVRIDPIAESMTLAVTVAPEDGAPITFAISITDLIAELKET